MVTDHVRERQKGNARAAKVNAAIQGERERESLSHFQVKRRKSVPSLLRPQLIFFPYSLSLSLSLAETAANNNLAEVDWKGLARRKRRQD